MPGIPAKYNSTFERLQRATKQLHEIVQTGEFHSYSYRERRKIVKRVRRLYNQLAGPVSPALLRGAVTAVGMLALAGCPNPTSSDSGDSAPGTGGDTGDDGPMSAPSFVARDSSTIGLGRTSTVSIGDSGAVFLPYYVGSVALADTDSDGDLDVYYSSYSYDYTSSVSYLITRHTNNGSGGFGAAVDNPSGLTPLYQGATSGWLFFPHDFVDIDNDGDLDLVGIGYLQEYGVYTDDGLALVENVGTAGAPDFSDPVILLDSSAFPVLPKASRFVDIDGDGDLDLITAIGDTVYLTKNSSGSAGTFTASPIVEFPYADLSFVGSTVTGLATADIDGDGDMDILVAVGTYDNYYLTSGSVFFVENTSSADTTAFTAPVADPFAIDITIPTPSTNGFLAMQFGIAAGDLDGDGDVDILVGPYALLEYDYDTYSYSSDMKFIYLENSAAN